MEEEKIDILLATYNGEKYIEEQIESILNQTYKNISIIISDDCSNDGTKKILEKYEDNPKIKVYYQEKNLGYVKNFEFLLKKVENNIYMLSDQDDIWKREKIKKSFKKLEEENADLVFTDLEVVDENLKTISKSFIRKMGKINKIKRTIGNDKLEYLYNNMAGCTILTKKKFIKKILPFPVGSKYIIHDSWIGLITSLEGKVVYLDEPTILYRQHLNNQVGIEKKSFKAENFDDIRNLFIEVKQDLFKTYLENNEKFPLKYKKLNKQGEKYFKNLKSKKYISFRGWNIFHKLYKDETFIYYILNFIILNIPILGKMLFGIRKKIKIGEK